MVKENSPIRKNNNSITLNTRTQEHTYTLVSNSFRDIVSLRVEVGHISVPRPEIIDWFTVAVEQGGFGRHD